MFYSDWTFLGFLGTPEIVIIAVVILVLFGATKIPKFMRSLGQGINEFKKASHGDGENKDSESNPTASVPPVKQDKDNEKT